VSRAASQFLQKDSIEHKHRPGQTFVAYYFMFSHDAIYQQMCKS
jgi:hypothetical protein